MRSCLKKRCLLVFLVLALSLFLPASSRQDDPLETPFFMEFFSHTASFNGELNGHLIFGNDKEVFYVPKLEPGVGFGFNVGRFRKNGQWIFSYQSSIHDASFRGINSQSYARAIGADSRVFLFKYPPIRPFILYGFFFPWMEVKNAAVKDGQRSAATFSGFGVNIGTGLVINFHPNITLSGGIVYRLLGIAYVKGIGKGWDLLNLSGKGYDTMQDVFLKVWGWKFSVSLGYTF